LDDDRDTQTTYTPTQVKIILNAQSVFELFRKCKNIFSNYQQKHNDNNLQQPDKMMSCTMIKSNRLGAQPWLKDEENFTYRKKGSYKPSKHFALSHLEMILNLLSKCNDQF